MTFSQLYRKAKRDLEAAGVDDPQFDAMCLIDYLFGVDRADLSVMGDSIPDSDKENRFLRYVEKRASGFPLQYIIGTWSFMDIPLCIGEGVLIPRDDTEVVVRETLKRIEAVQNPRIIDLCSGSGTISIAVAKARPDAEIISLELSETAFVYLEKNIEFNGCGNIRAINGDLFKAFNDFDDHSFDAVISNPPYIKSDVIETLSSEVRHEPRLALDGGEDGMLFYNSIAENWLCKIKHGGVIGVEIDEDLTSEIITRFEKSSVKNIEVIKDIAGLNRAIMGTLP